MSPSSGPTLPTQEDPRRGHHRVRGSYNAWRGREPRGRVRGVGLQGRAIGHTSGYTAIVVLTPVCQIAGISYHFCVVMRL